MPRDVRRQLEMTLRQLPGDLRGWRGLLDQAGEHLSQALGDKRQVAIVGPVNAGKSTLYNQFVRDKLERAEVSAVPGTTRWPSQGDAGVFVAIDTPGADAIGPVGEAERERALGAAAQADVIVVLFDASRGVGAADQALYETVGRLGKPRLVALNKADLIPTSERQAVMANAAQALGVEPDQIVMLSAKKGTGVERLLTAIAGVEPGIVAALGRALPAYRWHLAQVVIARAASTSAAIAVTPLPIVDFVPLVAVQTAMVLSLSRIYAYRLTLARAREVLVTFGTGLLGRTLFYELSKFGGPPGWLVAAAVAVSTTGALGYASALWFERGAKLSRQSLTEISQVIGRMVIERLSDLGRRRPAGSTLRQRLDDVLADLPSPGEMAGEGGTEASEPDAM